MSNSLLSLPEGSIESLTEHQLSDLLDYTDPGWVLVDDEVSPRRRRWLTRRVDSPLLFMAEPGWKVEDDRVFLILNSAEDIPEETGDEQDLCVVSNFIEEDVDPHSFSVNWTGLEPYRQLTESLPEGTSHLAVNHPTDRTITPGNSTLTLHGAGAPPDRTRFPLLNVGGSVYTEETLSHAKLGLQAIKGIGRSKARTLRESGFETRQTLQQQSPESLLSLDGIGPYYACVAVAGARAHETGTPLWFNDNPLSERERVYVDIETDSTRVSNIWLIGVYDEADDEYRSFLQTEDPADARIVPAEFAEWVHEHAAEKSFVAWFGKRFDFLWLDRFVKEHAADKHAETWLNTRRVDLLMDVVRSRLSLPVRSHKLDVVARRLGYERTHEGIDGGDAAEAYGRWCEGEKPDWDRWINYCRDDVMGMKHIYDCIRSAPRELDIDTIRNHYRGNRPVS